MFGYLGATAIGPRQQACLAAGGSWEGPVGKKKCIGGVAAGPLTIQAGTIQAAGALPKPGSTVTGPIPPEYIGTEKKGGAAGPKQLACQKNGGHWIGPEGRRWCQMVPGEAILAVAGTAPSPVAAAPSPVSTASIPPGAELSSQLPTTGEQDWSPEMSMAPGLQTGATGAPGSVSSGSSFLRTTNRYAVPGLAVAGIAVAAFFLLRNKRRGLRSMSIGVRRAFRRRVRRNSRRSHRGSSRRHRRASARRR